VQVVGPNWSKVVPNQGSCAYLVLRDVVIIVAPNGGTMTIECGICLPGCQIQSIEIKESRLVVQAQTMTNESFCPDCDQKSTQVHSYRVRCLRDLPVNRYPVQLKLRVKRFRCQLASCPRQTWTETIPEILERYARRTQRLNQSLWHIAYALGGKPGSRLAVQLRMPVSGDTLLRLLRANPITQPSIPRIIGIDDWAKRKGQRYGTIIVDLERRCVIDVLPDREPHTVADWLAQHRTIEIVARDRSAQYAQGIQRGAPQAIQVADRWHLLKNLWDVVERSLTTLKSSRGSSDTTEPTETRPRERFPRSVSEEAHRQARREHRIQQYHRAHYFHERGHSTRRIAQLLGISRGTVLRYLAADTPPIFQSRYVPSMLDPYLPYLKQRVAQGCTNTRQLWQEIRDQGYPGSSRQVDKWLRLRRRKQVADTVNQPDPQSVSNKVWPGPRTSTHLLLTAPEHLNSADSYLLSLVTQDPRLKALYEHAQQFITMLRRRDAHPFDAWIQAGQAMALRPYRHFVQSIEQDRDAVRAAIVLPWSNGQTEGQIHRLKLLKRQMYGRAKLDLLRIRLISPPGEHHICA
jgi:transposase